jgi:glyoxylase-like metal-dependent hydrolase (beta-lactamase superfamily II)
MRNRLRATLGALAFLPCAALAQTTAPTTPTTPAPAATAPAAPPLFATTKVEGTDNVYIFRYQGHQSMFVVTTAGVIATDPIGLRRPQAVTTYLDEIKRVSNGQPVKYLIYSHSHFDHIAGGQPFKAQGARVIAHKNAEAQLKRFPSPDVVMPDETFTNRKTITLGGTQIDLIYTGINHSDNSIVMRLPKEKIIFAVDFIPVQSLPFRNMPDTTNPLAWRDSLKRVAALDWERMIPGHPTGNVGGRLGTKDDVNALAGYFDDLNAEVKKFAAEGKCTDTAMKDVKLPKYEKWGNYATFLPLNVERMCYMANGN